MPWEMGTMEQLASKRYFDLILLGTARQGRNQTAMAVAVSPATRSRGGMKIFARGEDFRS